MMTEMRVVEAFVLYKTLDIMPHNKLNLGQIRIITAASSKIARDAQVMEFATGVESADDQEGYAKKHGDVTVQIVLDDSECQFLKNNFETLIIPAFAGNLDKRIIVGIANALGA